MLSKPQVLTVQVIVTLSDYHLSNGSNNKESDKYMPNQDNDIIQAAEEAQQVDLVEAEHELVLTDSEQKAALTALAKVY